ncbi:MAG: hypothetical protein N3B21_15525 [Clostridia bacterium]|nr:hypothetical protein [Clostridia bacterium]
MDAVIHAFHRKTESICPICNAPMYMVHWHNNTRSLMCLKCHFGFNYKD